MQQQHLTHLHTYQQTGLHLRERHAGAARPRARWTRSRTWAHTSARAAGGEGPGGGWSSAAALRCCPARRQAACLLARLHRGVGSPELRPRARHRSSGEAATTLLADARQRPAHMLRAERRWTYAGLSLHRAARQGWPEQQLVTGCEQLQGVGARTEATSGADVAAAWAPTSTGAHLLGCSLQLGRQAAAGGAQEARLHVGAPSCT